MKTADSQLQRTFYLMGTLVLVGALLYWGRPVLIPVTIAILVTFVLSPIVGRMERVGIPRFAASTFAVLGIAVAALGIVQIFTSQVRSLTSEIPAYKKQISKKIASVRDLTAQSGVAGIVDFTNDVLNNTTEDSHQEPKSPPLIGNLDFPWLSVLQSVAGVAVDILFTVVVVLVLTLLMLMRREDLRNRLVHLLGADNLITATRTMDDASKRISRFLLSQLVLNIGFGVVVACGLYLIKIPYAYVWGALAAILRYIPFLGGWLAAVFPLLASLVMPDWTPFFLTAVFFVVVEMLQANLVEPQVYGHSIGVSGPGQLIAILFWGCLWGPVGLIVSTPLTACVCVLARHFSAWRFIATLIGDEEFVEKPAAFYQRLLAGDSVEASDLVEEFIKEKPVTEVYDALLIPALLTAESDQRNGDLSSDDHAAIVDAVREIFQEAVAPREEGDRATANGEIAKEQVLVVDLPSNDETDGVVVEMLQRACGPGHGEWLTTPAKDIQANEGKKPSLVFLATSREKNLVRIRGLCKAVRGLFPETKILVGCWTVDNGIEQISKRLKDVGATAVCTSFLQARQFIDKALTPPSKQPAGAGAR